MLKALLRGACSHPSVSVFFVYAFQQLPRKATKDNKEHKPGRREDERKKKKNVLAVRQWCVGKRSHQG